MVPVACDNTTRDIKAALRQRAQNLTSFMKSILSPMMVYGGTNPVLQTILEGIA